MKSLLPRFLLLGLVAIGLCLRSSLVASNRDLPEPPRTLRVLFIGNSYTYVNDLPALVAQLLSARNIKLETESVTPGGATLEKQWNDGKAAEEIKKGHWDFVVLQEQSQRPFADAAAMGRYATLLHEEIAKVSAKTLLYETWAAKAAPEEQAKLTQAYEKLGRDLKAEVVPVGEAWKQALARGIELHGPDGRHPALAGSYLAACVFTRALGGSSLVNGSIELRRAGRPRSGLPLEQALSLEAIAEDTWKLAHR